MSEPVAWIVTLVDGSDTFVTNSLDLAEGFKLGGGWTSEPLYTADAIRAAVEAEREACVELMKRQYNWITNVAAATLIQARGAA